MTGYIRTDKRTLQYKVVRRSVKTICKTYTVTRRPRYPYPVYAKFWIQDFRAPRFLGVPLPCSCLEDQKMGVTTIIKDYGTDILDAIRQNNLQKLQLILEKQLKSDSKIAKLCVTDIKHKPSKKFACPLILAARLEDPTILHYMISKGTDPNFIHHTIYSSKRREIVTALHIAVDLGYYDTSEVLLSVNADCNIGDHNQETPLHIAVKKADRIISRMLLSKGADPTIPDRNGNAALHIATLYGHLELVKTLLKYDADIFQKGHQNAIAPHIAAREGHIHLIQLFCGKHLSNVNLKLPCFADGREKTPLHLSSENGHNETTKALLEQYGAEVNIKDSDGNTPLHCCVLNPYDPHRLRDKDSFNETARILIKHRVSINSKNAFGDSALHLAAMNHFQRIVEMLLEVGANPFIENNEKLKPIDVVPDDDPVTQQVLKMAMAHGPRPLKYPSPDTTLDKSSGTLSSGQTGSSRSGQNDQISLTTTGVGPTDSVLDRSLSIYSSASTLPSVFVEESGETKKHKNALAPDKTAKSDDRMRSKTTTGQTQTAKVTSAQQTSEKEIQELKQRGARVPGTRGTGRLSSGDSSYIDDTYSFMSESTMQDGSTQTMERHVQDVAIMARRDRKKLYNKRLQTSFDLDKSISMSDMTSQTDLSILAEGEGRKHGWYDHDPYESSRVKDKHHDPYKSSKMKHKGHDRYESSRNKEKYHEPYESSRHKDKHQRQTKEDASGPYKSKKGNKHGSTGSLPTQDSNQRHSNSKERLRNSIESDSDEYSENEDDEKSQITPYKSKKSSDSVTKPPPGSVRVNTLPGKPGTIELQYSGGPLTIALDTQAFNTIQPDQQGDYFYDQQGNKYPVSLIHALQQAAGLAKGEQTATPLVTTKTGDQVQSIYHSPLPTKQKKKENNRTGKPRMPTPPTDDEVIYANEEELQSMIDSSVASEVSPAHGVKSPPALVKTAITQRVYEETRTPKSPTSWSDRSTPTRAATKQQDHLRKILGRATPTRRGNTPTNVVPAGKRIFEFEETISSAPSESLASETGILEEEEIQEAEDASEEEASEVIPASEPAKKPPQIQPRRSLQTPKLAETGTSQTTSTAETTMLEDTSHVVETRKVVKTKKYPETPLVITKADDSFEENDEDSTGNQWDETPNASPEHKSFSQKLAWAKALEEGNTPSKTTVVDTAKNEELFTAQQDFVQVASASSYTRSRKSKSRPPLSPGYRKAVGGIIREEEEELEDALPEYTKTQEASSSEEESSEEEDSETDSEEEEESEGEEDNATKSQHDSHSENHSSPSYKELKDTSSSSDDRTHVSEGTVVKPVKQLVSTVHTEKMEVVTTSVQYRETRDSAEQLDRLKAEAIEKQVAGLKPISNSYGRESSPSGEYDVYHLGSGRQTPDSVYSESSYSGRGLNMRVTGDTPKAYTHAEKEHKRIEWIKAKPVGIESGSEYSDTEFGSVSSLNRSLSPAGSERARKWSEGNRPLYRKQTPTGTVYETRLQVPADQAHGKPATSDDESKAKMIGSYAKPYKSFGKIETRTDLLEEAMMTSPMSPMSPIHTIEEDEDILKEDDNGTVHQVQTVQPSKTNKEDKFQLRISPAQFLETDHEKIHSMDSDEGPDIDSASATVARSPFKKNIKMALPGPDLYETETIEQPVSIGASEEDLLKAAEINMTKLKRPGVTLDKTEIVRDTVSSTVVSVVSPIPQQSQNTEYYIVSTDSSNSEEETSESEESESEDITQYNEEPKRGSAGQEQDISDILAANTEANGNDATNNLSLPETNNKPRVPSLAEIDEEFNEFKDVETVEMEESDHTEKTNIPIKKTPFEEFTESPIISTKKVKKTKKKSKKVTNDNEENGLENNKPEGMEIEEYGAEPGMKRARNNKTNATGTNSTNETISELAEPPVNGMQIMEEASEVTGSKETQKDVSDIKKTKKTKKKKGKVSAATTVIEDNVQSLNVSVPESEGFPYSREISMQELESVENMDVTTAQNNNLLQSTDEHLVQNLQQNVNSTNNVHTMEYTYDDHIQGLKTDAETVAQKGKVFETSFGPEDEEVALINIAALERKKKKKEKRKKLKKQEEKWAEEQKQWHEKQDENTGQPITESYAENVNKAGNKALDDKTQDNAKVEPPMPAAEITFSGGIEVIDETHKKKKKKRDQDDPEKQEKTKKSKKKEEKPKKKKHKSKPAEESAEMVGDLPDPNSNSKNIPLSAENVVSATETVSNHVEDIKTEIVRPQEVELLAESYPVANESISHGTETMSHGVTENKDAVMDSDKRAQGDQQQFYNGDMGELGHDTEQSMSEEETESREPTHYTEMMSSTEQERRMWEIYQRQREDSHAKPHQQQGKPTKTEHIKETDIDADIIETNIDDDLEEYYHEIEEVNMDQNKPNVTTAKHPKQIHASQHVPKHGSGFKNTEEDFSDDYSFEEDEEEPHKVQIKKPKYLKDKVRQQDKAREPGSVALQKGGSGSERLQTAGRPGEHSPQPPHSWSDQKEQEEKMRKILQSYKEYDEASLDSEQYNVEYDVDTRQYGVQPGTVAAEGMGRDGRRQGRHPHSGSRQNKARTLPTSVDDSELMAEMWGKQHPVPKHFQPERHSSDRYRRPDTTSDNESSSARRRRQKKKAIKFLEDAHSDADISALDPLTVQPGKTLQEAALETLTASLQNQPKLQPRKPIEAAMQERPINYTRGVYRPQPVYWRGSRSNQSTSLSSRYDDSQLIPQIWSQQQQELGTESEEGEPDVEYLQPVSSRQLHARNNSPSAMPRPHGYPEGGDDPMDQWVEQPLAQGAFQPFANYEGQGRRVKIYDAEAERRRREEREAHRAKKRRKERAPKTNIGPVDFTKYPATAKLWMEQVDKETVQKSKTMYLSVMPEGMKPPPELENFVPSEKPGDRGDVFLPPQWVIARGRSLRRKKQRLDSQRVAAESLGSLSASGLTSGESDFEGADRPMSPGRQVLLFFRVSSNWTDLAWVLFEGIQTDAETKRMLADIQIKHPRDLTKQVHSCMHRWWKTKGPDATIEELRQALDIVSMPYIQEQYFHNRKSTLTSYTDTEDDLDISQISDNDPEVSRLIHEYQARSLNASFDIPGETLSPAGKMNTSKDSLLRRLEDKGLKIDRSRMVSNLSSTSRDSVFKRNSEMSLPTSKHSASQEYYDDYFSDGESKRAFVIVQPQLKQKDYNYESQI